MARLILLNGPPAVGKSTIAQRYLDDHPMALHLDVDRLRRLLGNWRDDPLRANRLAGVFALAAATAHLRARLDVVVTQYLGRPDQLARFDAVAAQTGAVLAEFVLLDTKDRLLARFAARTAAARTAAAHSTAQPDRTHLDAQDLLDAAGGVPQLEAMYDRLLLVVAARPRAQVVPARDGEIEATYRDVLARLPEDS